MKYLNLKRFKFSTILKNINFRIYNFLKISKFSELKRLNLREVYKYINIRAFDIRKFSKYVNPKTYNLPRIKKIDFPTSKFLILHLPVAIIFFGFLYLFIPIFYSYDVTKIEKRLCAKKNFECLIKGEANYTFFPSPRIKITNIVVNDLSKQKKILINIERAILKLSFKNLLSKEKHIFKKLELKNFKINFNLNDTKKYKNNFSKKINFIPVTFEKGQIIFFDKKNFVASIHDVNLKLRFKEFLKQIELKGKFLDDDIFISINDKIDEDKLLTDIILKMRKLNFLVKANLFKLKKDNNVLKGNVLIKKNKHKFVGIVQYKNNEISIDKSNVKNFFLDGEVSGKIKFLPFFNFDLDLDLNSINFTKLYSSFLNLDKESQGNLFKINKKINGKLNLSSEKVYSSYNLIKSFESRVHFNNGNIDLEQFLINLGKLGAADVSGKIINDNKFSNFKYESNIFIDNQKKFLSKFGIYNKQTIPSNIFVSGSFDLHNMRKSFYEISHEKKLNEDDINFIEDEFNHFMLSDDYKNLFYFPKFKNFIKSITEDTN